MVTKSSIKQILFSMASPGQDTWYLNCLLQSFLYARTVTKSWCSVGMFFDRCTNCKFINWYPDMTIWILVQCTVFWLKRIWNIIIQAGIFREYRNKCFWRPKWFGKGTTSVYGIADIKQEGRSSDYVVSEIKWEMPFSLSVLHVLTEVRHILVPSGYFLKFCALFADYMTFFLYYFCSM